MAEALGASQATVTTVTVRRDPPIHGFGPQGVRIGLRDRCAAQEVETWRSSR